MSSEEPTREEVLEALLAEANAAINELLSPPLKHATVVGTTERTVMDREQNLFVITTPSGLLEVEKLDDVEDLEVGDKVVCTSTGVIIAKTEFTMGTGLCAPVTKVNENTLEIDMEGKKTLIFYTPEKMQFKEGDLVLLDGESPIARGNLGREPSRYTLTEATGVAWDDIGGLDKAKAEMIEAIVLPHEHADHYKHYNKSPINGILLHGPPGCGKTMLGKAAATQLANLHGKTGESGFFYVKGPELLVKWVGETERLIRELFQKAREFKEEHGFPAVIFIDEADAVVNKRGSRKSSDVDQTIVPQFLAEMDGLEDKGALVILATNRSDALDPAITREGRIDRKIEISRPTKDQATEIFAVHLADVPLMDLEQEAMVKLASEQIFAEEHALYMITMKDGSQRPITLGNFTSGAMIAGIVDQATSIALNRDVKDGRHTGVLKTDMVEAIELIFQQNLHTNHEDEIKVLKTRFAGEIKNIAKVR